MFQVDVDFRDRFLMMEFIFEGMCNEYSVLFRFHTFLSCYWFHGWFLHLVFGLFVVFFIKI